MTSTAGGRADEPTRDWSGESAGTEPAKAVKGPNQPSIARLAAGAVGVVYVLIGLIGFAVTGFTGITENQGAALFGIFAINPFHNVVHLGVGGGLLLVSLSSHSAIAEGALIGGGLVYLLAAVLGFFNKLPILAIETTYSPDNFLHLASGAAALLLGVAGALQARRRGPREPLGGPQTA
jgi:hypothetical protein